MKKFLLTLLLSILSIGCVKKPVHNKVGLSVTPNLQYQLPAHGAKNWDVQMNANWQISDSLFNAGSCGDTSHAIAWNGITKQFYCQAIAQGSGTVVGTPSLGTQVGGNGVNFAAQNKPYINVQYDTTGVDCTGATDSSVALNALTTVQDTSSGRHLVIPDTCKIRLDHQWLIFGQAYLEIDGGSGLNASGKSLIFGCNGTSGPLILVSRSTYFYMTGVTVVAKGNGCSSSFTQSIQQANSAVGGYTNTGFRLSNFFLTSAMDGTKITNYIGWSNDTGQNQEMTKLENGYIHCQNSLNSYGIFSQTINADSTEIEHVIINNCYRGVNAFAGQMKMFNSNVTGNGAFSVFGSGGASIWHGQNGCVNTIIESVFAENSGQWINSSNDVGGGDGCLFFYAEHNQVSFQSLDPAVYPVNLGNTGAGNHYTLLNNSFTRVGTAIHNNTLIGTDVSATAGPGGTLTAYGNTYDTTNFTQVELTSPLGFQNGMWTWDNKGTGGYAPVIVGSPSGTLQIGQPGVAATTGNNRNGPTTSTCGLIWNGASVKDCFTWAQTYTSAVNPPGTLTLTHTGSTGLTTLDLSAINLVKVNTISQAYNLFINVSNTTGVDCTGATDSSTALNTLWDSRLGGNINGKHVIIPSTCKIRVDHPLVLFGQSFFIIDGGGREPDSDNGASISGCGTDVAPGAVLQITRSGHAELRGFTIEAKGLSCTSPFTGSLLYNNEVSGGVTTTDIKLTDMTLVTNRGNSVIPNYVALQISKTNAGQNLEHMKVVDSRISCASSPGSKGIAVLNNNSDHDQIEHNNISSCYFGIWGNMGGIIQGNNFAANGSFPIFGAGGANIYATGCASQKLNIFDNEMAENSGQMLNNSGCNDVLILGNFFGSTDVDPSVHLIDVNNGVNRLTLINNFFNLNNVNNQTIIGTSQPLTALNNTNITEFGNTVTNNSGGLLPTIPVAQGVFSFNNLLTTLGRPLILVPSQPSGAGGLGNPSPPITFRTNWDLSGVNTNYDFIMGATGSRNGAAQSPTFYLDRILPSNSLGVFGTMLPFAGGISTSALNWNTGLVSTTTRGTAGTTSYSYVVVARTAAGGAPSAVSTVTTGNATLDGTNFNNIQWYPIPGAAQYCVYRSASAGTPSTTGLLTNGCVSVSSIGQVAGGFSFNDTGLAGDSSAVPTVNTADGRLIGPTYQTTLSTPSSSTATCTAGQTWADANFVYVCTATNTIKRSALSTF